MDIKGGVLLGEPRDRRGLSKLDQGKIIGYKKNGEPIYGVGGGSINSWQETLGSLQTDGVAYNTSTTATSLLTGTTTTVAQGHAKVTIPANYLAIGKVLRVMAKGRVSTFTSGTLTLDIRFGSVIVFNGGAITTVISLTNKTFIWDTVLTCRSIGAGTTATMFGIGQFTSSAVVGSTGGAANTAVLPDNTPAVGTGFDSTTANVIDIFGTWSVNSASNSVQVHEYTVESLN